MALSRNARRMNAKRRKALKATDALNSAKVMQRAAIIRGNLSHAMRRDSSRGLVFDYSPTVNPVGYTRPMRWTSGAANVGQ